MDTSSVEIQSILLRLRRIERQNVSLRNTLNALAILFISLLVMGMFKSNVSEEILARRISVVNDVGIVRTTIEAGSISLINSKNELAVSFDSERPEPNTSGGIVRFWTEGERLAITDNGIKIRDSQRRIRLILGIQPAGPFTSLYDSDGRRRILTAVSDTSSAMLFINEQGNPLLGLAAHKKLSGMVLYDGNGSIRSAIRITQSGPALQFYHAGGKQIEYSIPPGSRDNQNR